MMGGGKRLFDINAAAAGLVLLAPVLGAIAATIRWTSPGPVLYRAPRIGQYGQPFTVYKFRTMVVDAADHGPAIAMRDDQRITPLGRWLRRFHLDELPQLVNVLRGEMSLVGPRPEDPRYVALYLPEEREVLAVRPGLTGLAQLVFRDEARWLDPARPETYVTDILPHKLACDRYYVRHQSFLLDLTILADTVFAVANHSRLAHRYSWHVDRIVAHDH